MKSLIAFLFTLSLSATASEYPDDPSKLLEQIVTCKLSHLDLKESTIAQRKLENLFTNILIKKFPYSLSGLYTLISKRSTSK